MKNKETQTIKIILIVIFSFTLLTAAGQPKDSRSIEKNIEIMENILEKLIVQESPIYFKYNQSFPGKYYQNFGILFNIKSTGVFSYKESFEFNLDGIHESISSYNTGEKIDIKIKKKVEESNHKKKEKIDKKIETTVGLLHSFFTDYTRSAMSLNDDEVIVVNIDMGEKKSGYEEKNKKPIVPQHIRMSAKVGDLKKYHTGKYSEDKLKNKISFEKIYDADYQREIGIMENIFDTALNKKTDGFIHHGSETDGLYIPGFGALFSIPVALSGSNAYVFSFNTDELAKKTEYLAQVIEKQSKKLVKHGVIIKSDGDKVILNVDSLKNDIKVEVEVEDEHNEHKHEHNEELERIFHFCSEDEFSEEQVDSVANEIQDEVIEILSLYGSTLKSVKDNEMINVTLDMGDRYKNKKINILAKKNNIMKCSQGKMKYDAFKKSVTVWKE